MEEVERWAFSVE